MFDADVLRWQVDQGPSDEFVNALFEMREIIEPSAASLAAERATDDDIAALGEAMDGIQNQPRGGPEQIAADIDFHMAILDGVAQSDAHLGRRDDQFGAGALLHHRMADGDGGGFGVAAPRRLRNDRRPGCGGGLLRHAPAAQELQGQCARRPEGVARAARSRSDGCAARWRARPEFEDSQCA